LPLPRHGFGAGLPGIFGHFGPGKVPLDWIAKRVAEAKTAAPIADAAATRLEQKLAGTMRERTLRNAEFAELARELIAAAEPPKTGTAP
jgi:hypothetical protein